MKKLGPDDPMPDFLRLGEYERLLQKSFIMQRLCFDLLKHGVQTEKYFIIPRNKETVEAWTELGRVTMAKEIQEYRKKMVESRGEKEAPVDAKQAIKDLYE